jgi:hypothetical protein
MRHGVVLVVSEGEEELTTKARSDLLLNSG